MPTAQHTPKDSLYNELRQTEIRVEQMEEALDEPCNKCFEASVQLGYNGYGDTHRLPPALVRKVLAMTIKHDKEVIEHLKAELQELL